MTSMADMQMERRKSLLEKAQGIAERGVVEGRDLTVEEQTSFDALLAEAGVCAERAQGFKDAEDRSRELNTTFKKDTGSDLRGQDPAGLEKWAREARIGDAFDLPAIRGAEQRAQRRVMEQRAMSATGGVAPDGVYGQLWEYAVFTGGLLQAGVDIINTTDGNTLPFPVATVHATTSDTPTAANASLNSSDATVTTVNSTVSKYTYLTLVPTELVQDSTFDLEGYIARAAGRELGRRLAKVANAAYVAGFTTAGVTGPVGTTVSFGAQATAGQGTDLLVQLFRSVLPEYRTNAAWVMSDPTIGLIQQLKGSTGDPVWQFSIQAGAPDMFLGKPVYADAFAPNAAANAKTVYFGEWDALKVRIAGGLRFERSNEYGFGNDQIAFRAIVRAGAVTVDPNAVKYFAQSAT